jgi:hypothetical protein
MRRVGSRGRGLTALVMSVLVAGIAAGPALSTAWADAAYGATSGPVAHGDPASPVDNAYWLVTESGGVDAFGVPDLGAPAGNRPTEPVRRWALRESAPWCLSA